MNALPDRLAFSLSALITEILAENAEDAGLRPLVMTPLPAGPPKTRGAGGGPRTRAR